MTPNRQPILLAISILAACGHRADAQLSALVEDAIGSGCRTVQYQGAAPAGSVPYSQFPASTLNLGLSNLTLVDGLPRALTGAEIVPTLVSRDNLTAITVPRLRLDRQLAAQGWHLVSPQYSYSTNIWTNAGDTNLMKATNMAWCVWNYGFTNNPLTIDGLNLDLDLYLAYVATLAPTQQIAQIRTIVQWNKDIQYLSQKGYVPLPFYPTWTTTVVQNVTYHP